MEEAPSSGRLVLWMGLLASLIATVHGDCTEPPVISYGTLKEEFHKQTTFATSSTVKYDCRPGYVRVPGVTNTATCLGNSDWSTPGVFCRLRSCGHPGDIENGYLEVDNLNFGTRITYFCDIGYNMISKKNYRECQADGTWSNAIPACEVVNCPHPPAIRNGSYYPEKDDYYYQDAVKYRCNDPNFIIEFESSLFCMENGNWSAVAPECIDVNCAPPIVPNSLKLSGFAGPYTLNSLLRFECLDGFVMNGSRSIVCDIDSEWNPSPPVCQKVTCAPPNVPNSIKLTGSAGPYKLNSLVRFKCVDGFIMNGSSSIVCDTNNEWNPSPPVCLRGFCPAPKLLNGKIKPNKTPGYPGYIIGDSIELNCNKGYTLKGKNKITCGKYLQWYPEIPICEQKDGCSSPTITNGRVAQKNGIAYDPEIHGHGFSNSDTIEVECDDGYELKGKSRIKCYCYWCISNPSWEPALPRCIIISHAMTPRRG